MTESEIKELKRKKIIKLRLIEITKQEVDEIDEKLDSVNTQKE